MWPLFALLFIVAVWDALKHGKRHAGADYRKSRDAKVKEAGGSGGSGGSSLTSPQRKTLVRRHATGYWLREVLGGFPVTRAGWEAGWTGHKTARAEEKARVMDERTRHADAQASLGEKVRAHRERMEAARKRAEGEGGTTVTADDPPLPSETVGGTKPERDPAPAPEPVPEPAQPQPVPATDFQPPADPGTNGNGNGSKPPATEGGPMPTPGTADVTYEQLITEADKIITEAEQELATIQQSQLGPKMESAASLLNDNNSLSNAAEVDEALRDREKAAQRVLDAAQNFKDGLQRDHGGINDAVADAPIPMAAQPEFYGE